MSSLISDIYTMNEKTHYVYLIVDLTTGKMYIGSRTSKVPPEEDLGKRYFSSSTDETFQFLQRNYPNRFKYFVLKTFKTYKEAIKYEAKLHKKFDVANNPMFYNKANQAEHGFVPSRKIFEENKKKFKETGHQQGEKNSMYGTKWILNHSKKVCTRIGKKEKVPDGWELGRKMDYKHVPRRYLEI